MSTSPHSPKRLALRAERLFDGDSWRGPSLVLVDDGVIRSVEPAGEAPPGWAVQSVPEGHVLAPGFIDVQVNGGGGVLLNDTPTAEGMAAIARAHRRHGTTGLLPTLISDLPAVTERVIEAALQAPAIPGVLGLHIEGPFFNPLRKGIHRADRIRVPDDVDAATLARMAGLPAAVVTLAPEQVGPHFIRNLADHGIRVSAGHTEASAADMAQAIAAGLTGVTHLFNAMAPMTARVPGVAGTALTDGALFVGIIGDGVTVAPAMLRLAARAIGTERLVLVTDAMPSVGMAGDRFMLLGREIRLVDGMLVGPDGTLAGAHCGMDDCVRNLVRHADVPLGDALATASRNPARFLGLERQKGAIRRGHDADLVALDPGLAVTGTWIAGDYEPA